MVDSAELIEVPDFRGKQTLNAWLAGHEAGLLLCGPDPDDPDPLLHGIVRKQRPDAGAHLPRWDVVTVWVSDLPTGGVREPRRPLSPTPKLAGTVDVSDACGDPRGESC